MRPFLKSLSIIFTVIGILTVALLIVYFLIIPDSTEPDCTEKPPTDTTTVSIINGLEDFREFKFYFIRNYTFQVNRAKFPVFSVGNMWSNGQKKQHWTLCNWKSLTPYYIDTLTYGIRNVEWKKNTPYEKHEEIFYIQDSATVTTLKFQNLSGKWYLITRTDHK